MALFGKKKDSTPAPQPTPAPATSAAAASSGGGISFEKKSGSINLSKGSAPIMMTKTAKIKATCSWASETDYDLYGYVITKDGQSHPVATFGASGEPAEASFAGIKHLGDVGRGVGGQAQEIIEIAFTDDVVAFVPVAYSAQSNGSGSFKRYKVGTTIDNGAGDVFTVNADSASSNDGVYTLVPGIVYNHPEGVIVQHLELYSKGGEKRPKCTLNSDGTVAIDMDRGPRNDYK